MTCSHRPTAFRAITLGAALSMAASLAMAGDNAISTGQIINALQPRPLTRSLSVDPRSDSAVEAREADFVQSLRDRKTRSLSMGERDQIAKIAATKPKIDLDIQFDYDSAAIRKTSMPSVQALGRALTDPSLKGSTFIVAGHTDAIGSEAYNMDLSERRADSIKRYLTEKYGIAATELITVGYGKDKPKDSNAPMDPINRRVQVVNMEPKTASK